MISEKTVELNLTTELINWLSHQNNTPYFAVGPTQAQEAKWGFDAGVFGATSGALIQYKRAYVNGTTWEWKLNRTKAQDQLARLKALELAGHSVFFAFPFFHTLADIQTHRRSLLTKTFWFKPSQINPAGGPYGHHEVKYDTSTKIWSVHSDTPHELPSPLSLGDVIGHIDNPNNLLSSLAEAFNTIVLGRDELMADQEGEIDVADILSAVCLVGRANV